MDDSTWKYKVTERNIKAGLTTRFRGYEGEVCLFCQNPDKSYKPGRGVEFICSDCVIILANAEQNQIKLACKKASELSSERQVRALESFIMEEEIYVQTRKTKRNMERERSVQSSRSARN